MFDRKKYFKEYYKTHKKRIKKATRLYTKTHPRMVDKAVESWRKKNRVRYLTSQYIRRIAIKDIAYKTLGGYKCKCGFSDPRALQIDHIKGGGSRAKHTTGQVYSLVIKYPERFQVLCSNCNWIKRYENKEVKTSKYAFNLKTTG